MTWLLVDPGPEDRAQAAAVVAAAADIAGDADVPDFGSFFLARHPKFARLGFPPIGWEDSAEVHTAIFDTLTACARLVKAVVWEQRA